MQTHLLQNLLVRAEAGVPLLYPPRNFGPKRLHLRLVALPHDLKLLLEVLFNMAQHLNAPRLLHYKRFLQSEHISLDSGETVLLLLVLSDHILLETPIEGLELVHQSIQPGCRRLLLLTALVGGDDVSGRCCAADGLRAPHAGRICAGARH